MNKALQVSKDSLLFTVTENNIDLSIGKLNLDDAYDENFKSTTVFQIVSNSQELKNADIAYGGNELC